jgi:ferredoxin
VDICPVDCFHLDETMLVIDPARCIDCAACVPRCPVDAIYEEDELPDEWRHYIDLNRERAAVLPVIHRSIEPLAED